jgi:hypothetical protein
MLTSFHKGLLAAFGVQVVLLLIVVTRSDDNATLAPHQLLPGFDAAKVTKLTISSSETKPAIELTKNGSDWVVASAFDYPVDPTRITTLLTPIAKMQAAAPISSQASRHKQLHVADDDYERKIVIAADGKNATLYIGSSAGTHRTAVRFANDDAVFAVKDVTAYLAGADVSDWVAQQYMSVDHDEIAKVSIHHGSTTIELSHDAAGTPWSVAVDGAPLTEPLDATAVNRLADDASTIRLAAPADPKRDASNPTATVTIERHAKQDKDDKSASVAAPPPIVFDIVDVGEKYWVKQRDLPRAVMVDKAKLDALVEASKAKLVKPPAAGSGAGSAAGSAAKTELPPPPMPPGELVPPP